MLKSTLIYHLCWDNPCGRGLQVHTYLDLAKCGYNVTDGAPGHRGDTAGAGAGAGVQGKINNNNGISGDR